MALTDADEKAKIIDVYGITLFSGEGEFPTADTAITVYRADLGIDEKYVSADYHSPMPENEADLINWWMGGTRDGKHEIVMIGTHTLADPDSIWTEWTGS